MEGLAGLLAEALVEHLQLGNAVEAEGAEVLAQLAPGCQQPDGPVERQRERPDRAPGRAPGLVAVGELKLVALAQGAAQMLTCSRVSSMRLPCQVGFCWLLWAEVSVSLSTSRTPGWMG